MNTGLSQQVCEAFKSSEWTLGFAESCTGGLVSSGIAQWPGVSRFFKGTVVSYDSDVKHRILKVNPETMQEHGEVSEPVAQQMARGATQTLCVDWAVSVTGVAGPTGGSEEKPVGTVCFGVVGPRFEKVCTHHFDKNLERQQIQQQTADKAYELLLDALKEV